jgi:mono/diheme cytochrome c family protein
LTAARDLEETTKMLPFIHPTRSTLTPLMLLLWLAAGPALLTGCEEDILDGGTPDGGMVGDDDDDVFTQLYQTSEFQMCADCHAPGAPGFVPGETESSLDFSSRDRAAATLQGTVTGLEGTNFAGCVGVPFVGPTPSESLLVAYFDASVRAGFSVAGFPDCDGDAIADGTLNVGPLSAGTRLLLDMWIAAGAPE